MSTIDHVDFFTDPSVVANPCPYYASLRAGGPVQREPHHNVMVVTGYEEASEFYRANDNFSNCVTVTGPFPPLPFEPVGDIGALIDEYREHFPMFEHLVTFDAPKHTAHRHLLKSLFTPRRLRENEEFVWRLADRQIDEFLAQGKCEFMTEYAQPFAVLVIADLLGVPEADRDAFRVHLGAQRPGATDTEQALTGNPLEFLEQKFSAYLEQRRREPGDDVLSALAGAKFPDGSTPEIMDLVRLACFLFAAGQDTTARLLTSGMRILAENQELQKQLRADETRIPDFVEETLRLEGPVKSDFRLTRQATTLGGVDIPAGTMLMVLPGAANRDPSRFENPDEFDIDRPNVREHVSFARGIHTCPGGPLARMESRASLQRILARMANIRISETEHGPADNRDFEYEPTYILRGLKRLHLEYEPVE
ncbi:cytochrome P450 [Nocardia callitridis]|uniref:Cytochrome P450 n=1 Tax=Nocardia callitridis TaxID=648753 RepID=A0ABP9KJX6_9NOCA